MEQIIENITKNLTSKLPDNQDFYTIEDLHEAGYPPFLVDWMQMEAWNYATESVGLMKSEWINLDSDIAQEAKKEYLEKIKSELTIPTAHCFALTQNGVEICLDLAVNTRKAVPEFIFKSDDELDLNELRDRAGRVTVNAHLALALERYVIRKEKLTLTFEKAKSVIEAIDQKLTSAHNPLKWADELKPVFALTGTVVDSDLLRQFFEDKGMNKIARKFDQISDPVSESDVIEIMSSADTLVDEDETDINQPSLFKPSEEDVSEIENQNDAEEGLIMDDEPSINTLYSDDEVTSEDVLPVKDFEKFEPDEDVIYSEGEIEAPVDEEVSSKDPQIEEDLDEDFPFSLEDENKEIGTEMNSEEQEKPELSLAENFITAESEEGKVDVAPLDEREEGVEEKIPDESPLIDEETEEAAVEPEPDEEPSLAEIFYNEDDESQSISEEEPESDTAPFVLDAEGEDDEDESIPGDTLAANFKKSEDETEENEPETPPFILDDEDDTGEENTPLLSKFILDDEPAEDISEFSLKPKTIYDELNLSKKQSESGITKSLFDFEDTAEVDLPTEKTDQSDEIIATDESDESDDTDEVPMWKSFLERGDIDHEPGFIFDEQPVQIDEDIYPEETDYDPEEPIIDLTKEEPELTEKIEEISGWLDDDSSRFIDEIFGGSEQSYEEALGKIVDFESWKEASRFIEKEIFTRNMIDVYEEVAVDFTDRLHSYFTEYKT